MCGIAGYSISNDNNSLIDLSKCIKFLEHRGPDSSSSYVNDEERIALVHTRLSIIDTSENANQPIGVDKYNAALVFNGEIYNFKELKKQISKVSFHNEYKNWISNSDTEVLLRFYIHLIRSGKSISYILNKLNGIFTFALFDLKENALHIARDAFGVKPLYYIQNEDAFYFSSEIKSLLKMLPEKEIIKNYKDNYDFDSINRYLTYLWNPGNGTPTKLISKLGPGEYLKIKKGKIIEHKKWFILPILKNKFTNKSSKEIKIDLRKLLRKAVQRQLVSDVPLGAFLSGGLDSSSIVKFAKDEIKGLETFTIKIKDSAQKNINDDYKYAVKVADYLDVNLNVVEVSPLDFISNIENMVYQLDEPLADPAALNVSFISSIAKKRGLKVLLSGTGGDDIFTGYKRHIAVRFNSLIGQLPTSIINNLKYSSGLLPLTFPLFRRFRKLIESFDLAGDERLVNFFEWNNKKILNQIYSAEFIKRLKKNKPNKIMLDFLSQLPEGVSEINKVLSLEQRFFLADHNLIYTDKMSMQNGVEVRVPFLDLDLVEYSSLIPDKFKQKGVTSKWILKKCMEGYLPKSIIYRKKNGFGLPIRSWIKNDLRDWVFTILSKDKIKERGLFNHNKVHELIRKNNSGEIDASYLILSLICMELWFDKFLK